MKKIQKKHIHSIVEDDESVTIKFGKNMDEEKESDSKIVDEPPMETESEKKQEEIQEICRLQSIKIEGKAGDICLMNAWCLHGGTANLSQNPRRMLICDLTAADNYPLMQPIVPSVHSGKIVAGKATRKVRFRDGVYELPKHYESDSFFGAQGQEGAQKEPM